MTLKPRETPASIEMTLAEVTKSGRVIKEIYANSFHRNFIGIISTMFNAAVDTGVSYTDLTGVAYSVQKNNANLTAVYGPAPTTTNGGIQVGSSNKVIDKTDWALDAPIANGSGAGQLGYSAMADQMAVATATGGYYDMTRTLTNTSGATVTIEEVALRCLALTLSGGSIQRWFMIDRTLFHKEVPHLDSVILRYRLAAL